MVAGYAFPRGSVGTRRNMVAGYAFPRGSVGTRRKLIQAKLHELSEDGFLESNT